MSAGWLIRKQRVLDAVSVEIENSGRCRASSENYAWFNGALGQALVRATEMAASRLLPCRYCATALQLGPGLADCLVGVDSALKLYALPAPPEHDGVAISTDWQPLPLGARAVDLIVLQHTLDFAQAPHQILREAATVLAPEGYLLVCGFNPLSLWGLRRSLSRWPRSIPWNGHFLTPNRVQDWISLLGLDLAGSRMIFYRAPMANAGILERSAFLEVIGARWWPLFSGAYLLIAQKRQLRSGNVLESRRQGVRIKAGTLAPTIPRSSHSFNSGAEGDSV